MADKDESRSTPLGLYERNTGGRVTGIEVIAVVLSLLWLLGAGVFFFLLGSATSGDQALRFMTTLLVIFLPVAMIWVGATAARSSRPGQRRPLTPPRKGTVQERRRRASPIRTVIAAWSK